MVLSGADSGRCHTGRQFRRDGLFDLHVSGPEFSRGDRFERGKSSLLSFPPPIFLSFFVRSLRSSADYVTVDFCGLPVGLTRPIVKIIGYHPQP